jgi:hypothetical protein
MMDNGLDQWRRRAAEVCAQAAPEDDPRFAELTCCCLFVGQSRSGHSVVGTVLNAHRHAVVAHNLDLLGFVRNGVGRQQLLRLILERDRWLESRDRRIGGYRYEISGTWLGEQGAIRVIGDKRAGSTSRYLAEDPGLLSRLADEIRLPLRIIHHVRNPWDNISSIWTRKTLNIDRTLEQAIDHYFEMIDGSVAGLAAAPPGTGWLRTFHEELIAEPKANIKALLDLVDLDAEPEFLSACAAFIHPQPRRTRVAAPWTSSLIDRVGERAANYSFLADYRFVDRDE